MAPSPIPAPLPPWSRALIQLLPLVPPFLQSVLEYVGELNDAADPVPGEWRHVQIVWKDSGNGDSADNMVTTLDIANITGGAIDPTWTDADYTQVDAVVSAMINDWCTFAQSRLRCVETRYYRRAFNAIATPGPVDPSDRPFGLSGPPDRIFPKTQLGTHVGSVDPNQVAITMTEKTAFPRHWGRIYWPFPATTIYDAQGRITTANVDSMATTMANRYEAFMAQEFYPVIATTQAQGQRVRGLLTVSEIQVDNIPDVVRRRRIHTTTYRKSLPV